MKWIINLPKKSYLEVTICGPEWRARVRLAYQNLKAALGLRKSGL